MSIRIVEHALPNNTHQEYDVIFHSETIHTIVTHTPSVVEHWLSNLPTNIPNPRRNLVGLDIEWLPNRFRFTDNPAATLQLCINKECLVFQILHASFIPTALVTFLANQNNTFVGVGIEEDVEKLFRDHNLRVSNFVELQTLAVEKFGEDMRRVGLKKLALRVMGKEMEKPKKISMSKWDNFRLSLEQVQYACIDAFVSFEIGRLLCPLT